MNETLTRFVVNKKCSFSQHFFFFSQGSKEIVKRTTDMDKLLLSLSFIALLTSLTVNSAPMPSSKLMSSIDKRQKKYSHSIDNDGDDLIKVEAEGIRMQKINKINIDNRMDEYDNKETSDDGDQRHGIFYRREDLLGETGLRQSKMIGFLPYGGFPFGSFGYSAPVFYPPEFYDDFAAFYGFSDSDEEIMSRQNPGNRRRPAGNFKNSPIYYVRLPPTPYMFVPGLGYVSQPPTYTPMSPVPPPISPFYNLPLDFISNGKPTNIYQWGSPVNTFAASQPQYVQQSAPQYGSYPSQYQRPQRPSFQRPMNSMNPYVQESKITNLKGPFLFNGRPEEIFLLQNSYNPIYPDPRFAAAFY